ERHASENYTVEVAPRRIDYTGHPDAAPTRAVEFDYTGEAAEARTLFSRGMALRRQWHLWRVRMLGPGDALVRDYRLSYGTSPHTQRKLLEQIEECAAESGVCNPPTRFTWHHGAGPMETPGPSPVTVPMAEGAQVLLMDATGDGLD